MSEDMITVITVTISNDTESACGSSVVLDLDDNPEQAALDNAMDLAVERFNDESYEWQGARTFHTVITFPAPKTRSTEIRGTLPEQPADDGQTVVAVEIK